MKSLLKITLVVYLLLLLWLVLFKTSLDIPSVLSSVQIRRLNLIPFTGRLSEMTENFIVFIPLGLLLGANFKKIAFWNKFAFVFILSVAIETIQYVLAIGVSDITDVITNTLGGLLGLVVYKAGSKHGNSEKTERIIMIVIMLLVAFCLFLRLFVFRVKY